MPAFEWVHVLLDHQKVTIRLLPADLQQCQLSRWLKAGLKIRPETDEIYKPVSRRVRVPAASSGVFLSDSLRERLTTLAAG
ncbi:hypothetical protein ACFFW8_07235 [Erwinia tracheiphila]